MGQHKGCTFFGATRVGVKVKPKMHKPSLRERLQEIVAEVMLVDAESITDSYEIKAETDLLPDGLTELIELSVAIESEWGLGEVFTYENEGVFESFRKLLEFVKAKNGS